MIRLRTRLRTRMIAIATAIAIFVLCVFNLAKMHSKSSFAKRLFFLEVREEVIYQSIYLRYVIYIVKIVYLLY